MHVVYGLTVLVLLLEIRVVDVWELETLLHL